MDHKGNVTDPLPNADLPLISVAAAVLLHDIS